MAVTPFGSQIRGVKSAGRAVLAEEAARVTASRAVRVYESHEFSVPSPVTNWSMTTDLNHVADCTCGRSAFNLLARALQVQIRNRGSQVVKVKFNDTAEDLITVEDGENLQWTFCEVSEVLFTNATGVAIPVRVTMG